MKLIWARRIAWIGENYSDSCTLGKDVIFPFPSFLANVLLKGQCHAICQFYKNLEGVFPSIEFQN